MTVLPSLLPFPPRFTDCGFSNFFGEHFNNKSAPAFDGVVWFLFHGNTNSLKELTLSVRPKEYEDYSER